MDGQYIATISKIDLKKVSNFLVNSKLLFELKIFHEDYENLAIVQLKVKAFQLSLLMLNYRPLRNCQVW